MSASWIHEFCCWDVSNLGISFNILELPIEWCRIHPSTIVESTKITSTSWKAFGYHCHDVCSLDSQWKLEQGTMDFHHGDWQECQSVRKTSLQGQVYTRAMNASKQAGWLFLLEKRELTALICFDSVRCVRCVRCNSATSKHGAQRLLAACAHALLNSCA